MESEAIDVWNVITTLAQEVNDVKINICANCESLQDVQYFKECGHAGCMKCLNDDVIKCLQCKKSLQRKDACKYENLDEVLTNVEALNNINKYFKEYNPPKVITFFSPESTINKRDHKGETRLHKDCREGKLDKVEMLLKTGVDLNTQDFAGWTALHEAVTAQNIDIVKLLLDYGASVSVPGLNYVTPLHIAVQNENVSLIKLLVEYGADLMKFDKDGKTPIDLCAKQDDLKATLCLTPRRSVLYKIYTIPLPKVFCMNVSDEDIHKLSVVPGLTISTENNLLNVGDITYFIVGDNKLNIKHVQAAMLQGSCIVNKTWIVDIIAKKSVVNAVEYIATLPKYALHKAFLNKLDKLPKLFDGLRFYFCHTHMQNIDGYKYTIEDLKILVNLGGGKVLTRRPHRLQEQDIYYPYHSSKDTNLATITYYLIYDEKRLNHTEHFLTGIMYKSSKWLIDCINGFCIIN